MATQRQKEKALERAAKAQIRYWDALHALEAVLDAELDDVGPALEDCTVEYLEHEYGKQGDDETCSGGCGRPSQECASAHGAGYCCDADDYKRHGKPKTWKQFERLEYGADPIQRMYSEAFEGETDNYRAKGDL